MSEETVVIVDYGAGNLRSMANIFDFAGFEAEASNDPDRIAKADRLVLPGVGAAGFALDGLAKGGLGEALDEAVRRRGAPLLCVCVGMQVLAREVTEFGLRPALGWTDGRIVPLAEKATTDEQVPHMGWSTVELGPGAPDWMRRPVQRDVYFCHSFALVDANPAHIAATSPAYGGFIAAVAFDTVVAVQFHPEKSQVAGLELIEGFCHWRP